MIDKKDKVRLIDFGFADVKTSQNKTQQIAGTPYFMSPESLDFVQGKPSDMWSLGVLLYMIISGHCPFKGVSKNDLFECIKKTPLKFDHTAFKKTSRQCKDLIRRLLAKDSSKRITIDQALQHEWFKTQIHPQQSEEAVDSETIQRLRAFKGKTPVKKAAMKLLVRMRSSSNIEMKHLREQFEKIDSDNTGLIDVKKLVDVVKAHFSKREADKIITELDTQGNHMINYTEFIAATMKVVEYLEEKEGQ